MPQPFIKRPDQEARFGGYVITTVPKCAVGIALVTTTWSYLEHETSNLIARATTKWEFRGDQGFKVGMPNSALTAAFDIVENVAVRNEMMRAALSVSLPREFIDELEKLFREIRARADERNRIAHGLWYTIAGFPENLFTPLTGHMEFFRWSEKDFYEIAGRIGETINKVQNFSLKASNFIASQHKLRQE